MGGTLIAATVVGLEPGSHGFHIHETGDCSASDGTSAGGHYNPLDTAHGPPDAEASARHVGDLGNIVARGDGSAAYERLDAVVALAGEHTVIGRAVIIHEGEDDLSSQPTGAAGKRLACGVIVKN